MGAWKCFMTVVYLVTATSALDNGYGSATRIRRNADPGDILIFDSSNIEVNLNDTVQQNCGVVQGTRDFTCVWESEQGKIIEVDDVHNGNVYDTYSKPENITDNQCGIVINSVQPSHITTWKCMVFVDGKTFSGSKQVVLRSDSTTELMPDINNSEHEIGNTDSLGGGAITVIVIGALFGVGLLVGGVIGVVRYLYK